MVELKYLRELAAWLGDSDAECGSEDIARWHVSIVEAEVELAERRREPVAQGPNVEDGLERCRDRAAVIVAAFLGAGGLEVPSTSTEADTDAAISAKVERVAHAMLAAERAPSGRRRTLR